MVQKEFIRVPLAELVPYENNPRKNDEAAKDVEESIRQVTDLDPIEVDENNVILSGHTRLKALQNAGYEETDIIRYTGLTEEHEKQIHKSTTYYHWRYCILLCGNNYDERSHDENFANRFHFCFYMWAVCNAFRLRLQRHYN